MNTEKTLKEKIAFETEEIRWKELTRFFAAGKVIQVDKQLSIVDVAYEMSVDNQKQIAQWLEEGSIKKVEDSQAAAWYEDETTVMASVVKPWVLVQAK